MANDDFPPTHPEAGQEIAEAILWHEKRRPDSARNLALRIKALVHMMKDLPESGSPYLFESRRLLLRTFPYELVYILEDGHLLIIALAHTSRPAGYWAHRLN